MLINLLNLVVMLFDIVFPLPLSTDLFDFPVLPYVSILIFLEICLPIVMNETFHFNGPVSPALLDVQYILLQPFLHYLLPRVPMFLL